MRVGLLRTFEIRLSVRCVEPSKMLRGITQLNNKYVVRASRGRTWIRTNSLVLSVVLITASVHSQNSKTPFAPVPVDQRKALASRLKDYTNAFRRKDWNSLYDLASDVNKKRSDGTRISRMTFGRVMKDDSEWYRLLEFTPIRAEMTQSGQFDLYGCGEFPSGEKDPEHVAVAVRAVREHYRWVFTTWDYFDPREPCSNLSDPAWKPSRHLSLDYLPELACVINVCEI